MEHLPFPGTSAAPTVRPNTYSYGISGLSQRGETLNLSAGSAVSEDVNDYLLWSQVQKPPQREKHYGLDYHVAHHSDAKWFATCARCKSAEAYAARLAAGR